MIVRKDRLIMTHSSDAILQLRSLWKHLLPQHRGKGERRTGEIDFEISHLEVIFFPFFFFFFHGNRQRPRKKWHLHSVFGGLHRWNWRVVFSSYQHGLNMSWRYSYARTKQMLSEGSGVPSSPHRKVCKFSCSLSKHWVTSMNPDW